MHRKLPYPTDRTLGHLSKINSGSETVHTWNSNKKFDSISVTVEGELRLSHGAVRDETTGSQLGGDGVSKHSYDTAWHSHTAAHSGTVAAGICDTRHCSFILTELFNGLEITKLKCKHKTVLCPPLL